ncbi:MAG TPA: ferredoxin--NADP reductase [Cytophagaceae bacterium]
MSQYYLLKVKEVIRETEEAVTLVFDQPKEPVVYKPGQFLTLLLTINGEKLRRSYSLCTAPGIDKDLAVTVKKVIHGKVSTYLVDKVKVGDIIEVMQPMGTFTTEHNPQISRTVVLLAAGSGITPLMSILKSVLVNEPLSKVVLLYGNRNENSIIFYNRLQQLQDEYKERLKVFHVLSQPISTSVNPYSGARLSQSLIIKILETTGADISNADYYICGPEGMMLEALNALSILKIPGDKIHKESFATTVSTEVVGQVVNDSQTKEQEVVVVYQGTEYKFTVPINKSILEAALDQDIDLPYSCQSGLCTACMGKCVSGKVHLDSPDGLSDKEIQQGYVLTCVGHPVTSDVVIEID